MYTKEELGFILYNNRSVNGTVNNFIPNTINPFRLIKIEKEFERCKFILNNDNIMIAEQNRDNMKSSELTLFFYIKTEYDKILNKNGIIYLCFICLNQSIFY